MNGVDAMAEQVAQLELRMRRAWYPDPEELDRLKADHPSYYNELLAANREEREVRHDLRRTESAARIRSTDRGQLFGFLVAIVVAVGGAIALVEGHTVGIAAVFVGLGPVIAALIPQRGSGRALTRGEGGRDQPPTADEANPSPPLD